MTRHQEDQSELFPQEEHAEHVRYRLLDAARACLESAYLSPAEQDALTALLAVFEPVRKPEDSLPF